MELGRYTCGPRRERERVLMHHTYGMWWSAACLIAAGSVLALSACTPTSDQPSAVPEVRIGLLGALSGPGAATGQEAVRGAELAALVVNQVQSLPVPLSTRAGLPGLGRAKIRILRA